MYDIRDIAEQMVISQNRVTGFNDKIKFMLKLDWVIFSPVETVIVGSNINYIQVLIKLKDPEDQVSAQANPKTFVK